MMKILFFLASFTLASCSSISFAAKLFNQSCKGGNMVGCFNLGLIEYKKGNISKAAKLYNQACKGGDDGGVL